MTPDTLNERLALALGRRRCDVYPEYWVKPGDPQPTADSGLCYEQPNLLTGDGMLTVLEALRGQGAVCEIVVSDEVFVDVSLFPPNKRGVRHQVRAATLPKAVAVAALVALEGERDE